MSPHVRLFLWVFYGLPGLWKMCFFVLSSLCVIVMESWNMSFCFIIIIWKKVLCNMLLNDCSYPCTVVSTDGDSLELWDIAGDRCFRCTGGDQRTNHRHGPLICPGNLERYRLRADQLKALLPRVWRKEQQWLPDTHADSPTELVFL